MILNNRLFLIVVMGERSLLLSNKFLYNDIYMGERSLLLSNKILYNDVYIYILYINIPYCAFRQLGGVSKS